MKRIIDAPDVAATLFPPLQFGAFLDYIRRAWDGVKAQNPAWWSAKKETTLVDAFYSVLNNDGARVSNGVGFGHFFLEASEILIDPGTNMPKRIGRTDICFAYASSFGPILTMEFKRLNNGAALRRKYFTEGVARFVAGKYAPAHDTAIMIGMTDGSAKEEKGQLLKYLMRPLAAATLKLKPLNYPTYGDPSQNSSLDFDTSHDREASCSAPIIRIGHMLLER